MLALSVSISTSSSPRLTSSPSDFSHLRIVPSSIESDRRGIATSAMPGNRTHKGRSGPLSERGGRAGRLRARRAERRVDLGPRRDVAADRHHADHAGAVVAQRNGLHGQAHAAGAADPLEVARLAGRAPGAAARRARSPPSSRRGPRSRCVPSRVSRQPSIESIPPSTSWQRRSRSNSATTMSGTVRRSSAVELVAALQRGGDAPALAVGGQLGEGGRASTRSSGASRGHGAGRPSR